ncbi:MAG: HAD family phosphatase [Spirochaetaceae bacterium]|nr:MAG: HAD family phosphatase [Spirochaetaceae bacterium]
MSLRFRCLILDHDDTAVNSTALIHHPSHVEAMRVLRPQARAIDLQGWFLKNFDPGIMRYLTEELTLSAEELQIEYKIWREFNTSTVPPFFPGFLEALEAFRALGGTVTVVSHSEKDVILNTYRAAQGGDGLLPDLVFGWDYDETRRKPHPWPVQQILQHFNLSPGQALIVDDLKPGVLMSRATGVPIAAAGWAHQIPQIRSYMREHCNAYFDTVAKFRNFICSGNGD